MAGDTRASRGAARATFREVVNEATTRERVEALIDQALSISGLVDGFCPDCRRKVRVEVPNVKARIDALVALLEQAEGKPGSEEAGVVINVQRPPWPGS